MVFLASGRAVGVGSQAVPYNSHRREQWRIWRIEKQGIRTFGKRTQRSADQVSYYSVWNVRKAEDKKRTKSFHNLLCLRL